MLLNIFSSFDPMWFNLCYKKMFFMLVLILLLFSSFWTMTNKCMMILNIINSNILNQFKKTNLKHMKGSMLIVTSLFFLILYMNLIGMIPYFFSVTSHIIFTMSMGLPIWCMFIISSFNNNFKMSISHLLPDSAPLWLNPFLIIIESVSIIIRPVTLSFRLAANMTAGHIVLMLMSSFSVSMACQDFVFLSILSSMYIIFEIGICFIQAYIFSLLISLYSNDHS